MKALVLSGLSMACLISCSSAPKGKASTEPRYGSSFGNSAHISLSHKESSELPNSHDPQQIIKNAIDQQQAKFEACYMAPSKKNDYFVGEVTYELEFKNRQIMSLKRVDSTFQEEDLNFYKCIEKVFYRDVELESQAEGVPYNARYPLQFGMDRE